MKPLPILSLALAAAALAACGDDASHPSRGAEAVATRTAATPTFAPSPRRTVAPQPATPQQAGGCHPAYPSVCIPPPPPDLDCPDVPFRRFVVRPPDPHRFDADGDGIGCER